MQTDTLQAALLRHFQWLHAHPELSYQEHGTTQYIKEALLALGLAPLNWGLPTGAACVIEGKSDGPLVALRCDIDALPIEEQSGLPYASQTPGMMHACGHDFHTAAMLGTAQILQQKKEQLNGSVLLLFQPAEEKAGGAAQVLGTGVLNDVQQIYGLHVSPKHDVGTIALCEGPDHAAVDKFAITLTGRGGHAGLPHTTIDPIVAASALVQALQSIVSRGTDPFDKAVVSVTQLHAGSAWNIIPEQAFLEGTVRTLRPETRARVKQRIEVTLAAIATAYEATAEIEWDMGCPATNNNPALTGHITNLSKQLGFTTLTLQPDMSGEDFALYQQKIPGVFVQVGTGVGPALHNPAFKADPAPLASTANLLAEIAIHALGGWQAE